MNPGIETVVDYLSSVPAWYLATCEGDQPHVRPFSFVAGFDGRIWFCTGKQKDVFHELEENPRLEVSAWKPGSGWLVLRGEADFTDEVNDLIRRAGFAHMRSLGEAYEGIEDENLIFFSVRNPRAWIRDIDGSETELDFVEVPPAWMVNDEGKIVETADQVTVETVEVPEDMKVHDDEDVVDETLVIEQPHDDFMQEPQAFYAEPNQDNDQ